MTSNLAVNETLLERALNVGGLATEDETVNLALNVLRRIFWRFLEV
ncbi:MAG: hypothetical protein Ta2G_01050 [Termitinemataceae bacterium]|nr:MAG: hypothetical protein Ta2G_01050 [Termitinemataceae bacterium]